MKEPVALCSRTYICLILYLSMISLTYICTPLANGFGIKIVFFSKITYNTESRWVLQVSSRDLGLSGDHLPHQWPHQASCGFHGSLGQNVCLENVPTEMKKNNIGICIISWSHPYICCFNQIHIFTSLP